jgi:hypothetical protein
MELQNTISNILESQQIGKTAKLVAIWHICNPHISTVLQDKEIAEILHMSPVTYSLCKPFVKQVLLQIE